MNIEKVRLSIGYPYPSHEGRPPTCMALLFAFSYQDPVDLRITWVAGGTHGARYVVDVLRRLCAPEPAEIQIDEEGEFVYLRPTRLDDDSLRLTFDLSERRDARPAFDVTVSRSVLITEAEAAVKRFCAHDFLTDGRGDEPARFELLAAASQFGS